MNPAPEPILVACLCAAWCDACRAYREVFDAAAARLASDRVRFVWVDIEDEADALGELEVENFPTLLVARGAAPLFVGPVLPLPNVLVRLAERAVDGQLADPVDAPDAARLAVRLLDRSAG